MKRETVNLLLALTDNIKWLALGGLFYFLMVSYGFGSAACLTHREARQLWPRQHIYWYSADHCWSNRRGPPRNLRYDLIRENHAQVYAEEKAKPPAHPVPAPPTSVLYPSLKQMMQAIEPSMLDRSELTLSYRLLDIDEMTKNYPDPPECCWPELVPDGKGDWRLK